MDDEQTQKKGKKTKKTKYNIRRREIARQTDGQIENREKLLQQRNLLRSVAVRFASSVQPPINLTISLTISLYGLSLWCSVSILCFGMRRRWPSSLSDSRRQTESLQQFWLIPITQCCDGRTRKYVFSVLLSFALRLSLTREMHFNDTNYEIEWIWSNIEIWMSAGLVVFTVLFPTLILLTLFLSRSTFCRVFPSSFFCTQTPHACRISVFFLFFLSNSFPHEQIYIFCCVILSLTFANCMYSLHPSHIILFDFASSAKRAYEKRSVRPY